MINNTGMIINTLFKSHRVIGGNCIELNAKRLKGNCNPFIGWQAN